MILTWTRRYRPNDVVMVWHNGIEKIKRIQEIKDGKVYVVGDNPANSTDSRSFGWIDTNLLRGRVVGTRLNRLNSSRL